MKDGHNNKDIQQLYREYQEKRDSTPSAMLRELLDSTRTEKKELQITAILEAAKTSAPQTTVESSNTTPASRFKSFWNNLFSPSFGGLQWAAVPLVVVAVLAINLLPSTQTIDPYLDISYLDNCQTCDQFAMTAMTKTRSIDLNINKPHAQGFAKLGRLVLDLSIYNQSNDQVNDTNRQKIMRSIQQHAKRHDYSAIEKHLTQYDTQHRFSEQNAQNFITFLNTEFSVYAEGDIYFAGQWLERLRVSNAAAQQSQNYTFLSHALDGADTLANSLKENKIVPANVLTNLTVLTQIKQTNQFDLATTQTISKTLEKIYQSLNM